MLISFVQINEARNLISDLLMYLLQLSYEIFFYFICRKFKLENK